MQTQPGGHCCQTEVRSIPARQREVVQDQKSKVFTVGWTRKAVRARTGQRPRLASPKCSCFGRGPSRGTSLAGSGEAALLCCHRLRFAVSGTATVASKTSRACGNTAHRHGNSEPEHRQGQLSKLTGKRVSSSYSCNGTSDRSLPARSNDAVENSEQGIFPVDWPRETVRAGARRRSRWAFVECLCFGRGPAV